MNTELMILSGLVSDDEYMRKAIPFLKAEYFQEQHHKLCFKLINEYIDRYNTSPSIEALQIELNNTNDISQDTFDATQEIVTQHLKADPSTTLEYRIDVTEKFCQDKAIYNAIIDSIKIMEDKNGAKGAIPQLLSDALAVSFDSSIGHDFLDDFEARFDYYHRVEERIPFDIDYLNEITGGGLWRKTLNVLMAETGAGKSLCMCHMAAANLSMGKNVLYITLEMSEEKIAERIDANLLNMPINELQELPKSAFVKKIQRLREKTIGKLIIKEYPTSSAGSANFRHLINELKIKKNFVPDIIYIDYLNICASSRLKSAANVNSYTYVKAIAEEIRGLAIEFNVPIVSATQANREGFGNSDISMTNTSESIGLPQTLDLFLAVIATDELKALNQVMFKQLKNRYGDPERLKRFIVGIDRPRMKLYDCEPSAQNDIMDDTPVYDKTPTGEYFDTKTGEIFEKRNIFDDFK